MKIIGIKNISIIGAFCAIIIAVVGTSVIYRNFTNAQAANAVSAAENFPASPLTLTKIPILIYHSVRPYYPGITDLVKEYTVPPDIFEEQLKYMKNNGFTPVTPDDVVGYFDAGKTLPPKPFMITLDDGWENQYRYAFPILKKYKYPAVFYIYNNAVGKKVFMNWDQVRTMTNANMIIGGHTGSHPELPKITSLAILDREIINSKKYIENQINKTIDTFAYPFGEYNSQDISVVKQAGYTSARTVAGCVYQSPDNLFTLCGVIITGDFNRFVAAVNR